MDNLTEITNTILSTTTKVTKKLPKTISQIKQEQDIAVLDAIEDGFVLAEQIKFQTRLSDEEFSASIKRLKDEQGWLTQSISKSLNLRSYRIQKI